MNNNTRRNFLTGIAGIPALGLFMPKKAEAKISHEKDQIEKTYNNPLEKPKFMPGDKVWILCSDYVYEEKNHKKCQWLYHNFSQFNQKTWPPERTTCRLNCKNYSNCWKFKRFVKSGIIETISYVWGDAIQYKIHHQLPCDFGYLYGPKIIPVEDIFRNEEEAIIQAEIQEKQLIETRKQLASTPNDPNTTIRFGSHFDPSESCQMCGKITETIKYKEQYFCQFCHHLINGRKNYEVGEIK